MDRHQLSRVIQVNARRLDSVNEHNLHLVSWPQAVSQVAKVDIKWSFLNGQRASFTMLQALHKCLP